MNNVLLVEDEIDSRLCTRRVLTHAGFSVTEAANGTQALNLVRAQRFDFVLTDWCLEGPISGVILVRAIRKHKNYRDVPLILISGIHRDAEAEIESKECGADFFFDKFELETFPRVFLRRIGALIRARRAWNKTWERATYKIGDLRFDAAGRNLYLGRTRVVLNRKEILLLDILLGRPNMVHSHEFLWSSIWSPWWDRPEGWRHVLESRISSLRGKIGLKWGARLICRKGQGYQFCSNN